MSPYPLTSVDPSEKRATLNPDDVNVQLNAPSLYPFSTNNNCAEEPESSNSSAPPPYARNTPLDNPFRDGNSPVGYSYPYPNGNGVQSGLKPATATNDDASPAAVTTFADPLPPVSSANDDPFAVDLVLDESLSARSSGLRRGLHIPSRASHITWGFSFPEILAEQGVTRPQWKLFMHDLKAFASMSFGQWATVLACSGGLGLVFGYVAIPAALICHYNMKKHREHKNFVVAYQGGAMKVVEDRWNDDYFHQLGLHIRIEPPGIANMDGMDLASSKLFRYQQKKGTSAPAPGVPSKQGKKKEYRYQSREGRYRMKAARKARVIVLPLNMANPQPSNPRTTDSESHGGQSLGTTVIARPSVQDFASLNSRRSGSEGLHRTPNTVQPLASSQQRQSSSKVRHRSRSEDNGGRTRFFSWAPTTQLGGGQ